MSISACFAIGEIPKGFTFDAKGTFFTSKLLPFKYESYIEAENGVNVVLTLDWTVQSYLEKQLEIALRDNKAANKVCGIVMDVNTCEVLAMSTKPDFNPNNHNEMTDLALEFMDSYLSKPGNEEENEASYKNYLWKKMSDLFACFGAFAIYLNLRRQINLDAKITGSFSV